MSSYTRQGLHTGARHEIRLVTRRWKGFLRRLDSDEDVEFHESVPLRPRGAQVILDPFRPRPGLIAVAGCVASPARMLDPAAQVQAWIEGQEVTLDPEGCFRTEVKVRHGHDSVHFRALDGTKLEGRGVVGTWCPRCREDEGAHADLLIPHGVGGYESARRRPRRGEPHRPKLGRTRAEVQRFLIYPLGAQDHETLTLILKGGDGAELGRVDVALERTSEGLLSEWVCITATDTREGASPLPAVEGKVLRAPDVTATIELQIEQHPIGEPLRLTGWDPARPPFLLAKIDFDAPALPPLLGRLAGAFKLDKLNLRWLADADEDDVLLQGPRGARASPSLRDMLRGKASALEAGEPVEFESDLARVTPGWAALELRGKEGTERTRDRWAHRETFEVFSYIQARCFDDPQTGDFIHAPRPTRVVWDEDDDRPMQADQVIALFKEGTTDDDVTSLCRKFGLRPVATVRRDRQFLLEALEPLDAVELKDLIARVGAEGCIDHALMNSFLTLAEEDVASANAVDVLRTGSAAGVAPQRGCLRPYDILLLRHNLQTRAYPAQQLLEKLRATLAVQPRVNVALMDFGFGDTTNANISPDFSPDRLPWGGYNLAPFGMGAPWGGTWGGSATFGGAGGWPPTMLTPTGLDTFFTTTFPFTSPAMVTPPGVFAADHGTYVLHAMAGGGTARSAFSAVRATAPAAPIANYQLQPWCAGVAPMADVLPIFLAPNWFNLAMSLRWAFLHGFDVFNTSLQAAMAPTPAFTAMFQPAFQQATAVGAIWCTAGGNNPNPFTQNGLTNMGPVGPRVFATTPPLVVVPATELTLMNVGAPGMGGAYPLNFTSPTDSRDLRLTTFVWNSGPEATVAAAGTEVALRLRNLSAPSTQADLLNSTGTSFAVPQVSGLFAMLFLADRVMGRNVGRPALARQTFANKLIDLVCYTAYREASLFSGPGEFANQFSNLTGHGRIDCWGAMLSVLNDGPMAMATAPHAALQNMGPFVPPAGTLFYGFELDTPVYHAQPVLVNADTGDVQPLTDSMALDPVIDAGRPAPSRPIWAHTMRAQGAGDRYLPISFFVGPDPSFWLQFSIRRARLQAFTHLMFRRPDDEPAPAATPGVAPPDLVSPSAARMFYGLPLPTLLAHNTTDPGIAPWNVDLRHFVFKTHTYEHGRRLRVTFDRVLVLASTAAVTPHAFQARVAGPAAGPLVTGFVPHPAATGATVFLTGPEWSRTFFQPSGAPLNLGFDVQAGGVALGAPVARSFPAPAEPPPVGPAPTPWGFGERSFDEPGGRFRVFVRVEQEPNLDRYWRARLVRVRLVANTGGGRFRFSTQVGRVRSAAVERFVAPRPIAIGGSVGAGGVNAAPDVEIIQQALVDRGRLAAGTFVPGTNGPTTEAAIRDYQVHVAGFQNPDSRVDVAPERTITRMNSDGTVVTPVDVPAGAAEAVAPWIPDERPVIFFRVTNMGTLDSQFDWRVVPLVARADANTFELTVGPFRARIAVDSIRVPPVFGP